MSLTGSQKKGNKFLNPVPTDEAGFDKMIPILKEYINNKEIAWSIETTKANQIIAKHNTAYGNTAPTNVEEIEITGTPTMMKVKDGKVEEYAVGVDETLDLMKQNK